jgi:hypothetical protein
VRTQGLFGFHELKKGYFPHYFNTNENQNYIGPIHGIKYYVVDRMKKGEREKFQKWHAEELRKIYVFGFQKEFFEYYDSDVDILRRGCLELRKQIL